MEIQMVQMKRGHTAVSESHFPVNFGANCNQRVQGAFMSFIFTRYNSECQSHAPKASNSTALRSLGI